MIVAVPPSEGNDRVAVRGRRERHRDGAAAVLRHGLHRAVVLTGDDGELRRVRTTESGLIDGERLAARVEMVMVSLCD